MTTVTINTLVVSGLSYDTGSVSLSYDLVSENLRPLIGLRTADGALVTCHGVADISVDDDEPVIELDLTPQALIVTPDGSPSYYRIACRRSFDQIPITVWVVQVPDTDDSVDLLTLVGAATIPVPVIDRILSVDERAALTAANNPSADNPIATIADVGTGGGGGVVLGETSTTAYRGDRGKIAYDHSQSAHAPANATAAGAVGDAFATSHLSDYAHANIANGQTAYGWGNHASAGYLTSVTNHDHASNKLSQVNTHESADTDSATTSLHHTIGTGANNAAAGNHAHAQLHDAVTVADSTSIDLTLSGQQISAAAIFGASSGTVCQGNDSRLSDSRAPTAHNHAASEITSGTVATARLGSGTADSSTYLRGDQTWATVSGGSATQAFGTITVSGQSNVVADAAPDTLTLVAGSNITITTDAGADSITIAASGGGATNLSVANKTATTLDIASDTGNDATIPAATVTDAGLMTAAGYTKLSGIEASATAAGATGDAFATSHLLAFAHGNIANGQTAYGWGNHASAGYLTSVTYGTTAGTACQGNDSRLSDARTPTSHDHSANKLAQSNTHESADTDSATTALHHTIGTGANNAAAGNHTHAQLHDAVTVADSTSIDLTLSGQQISAAAIFGSSVGTICQGNDSRLSDSRAPTNHDHASNKLSQANTHESADTDTATSSLHHTIGTGANQAAAGNHSHSAASTSAAGFSPQATAPAANSISALAIANGETARTDKVIFAGGVTSIEKVSAFPDAGSRVAGRLYVKV